MTVCWHHRRRRRCIALCTRLIFAQGLQQTAALFVGIPALLAIVVVFAVSPRSATGVACKAVTVGLLVSLLMLGEGMVCVAMSAPLFYAIAIAIARGMESRCGQDEPSRPTLFSCLILLALVPMSLEGVTPFTTLNREETVTESRIIHASPEAVERALFEAPRFERVLPALSSRGVSETRVDTNRPKRRSDALDDCSAWRRNAAERHGAAHRRSRPEARRGAARRCPMARRFRQQSHDALSDVARDHRAVAACRRADDESDVDAALPPRPRSVVLLRTDGAIRRAARRGISHRVRGHTVMLDDRYLLVRAASLYISVIATGVIWMWRRPTTRIVAGAVLAFFWNLPIVLALHLAAAHFGWWRFDARGGLFLGMPVELYSRVGVAVGRRAGDGVPFAVASCRDPHRVGSRPRPHASRSSSTPAGARVAARVKDGLSAGLLPGQLLARWTMRGERLVERAALQVVAFTGLVLFVLPAIAIEGSGGAWLNPFGRPAWQFSLLVQALACPALLGLTAVQEFVGRGGGTPVPFDPPRQLVTTGVYAYIRNPMQLSAVVLLFLLGVARGKSVGLRRRRHGPPLLRRAGRLG